MNPTQRHLLQASWHSWVSSDLRPVVGPRWLQWLWTGLFSLVLAAVFTVLGFVAFASGKEAGQFAFWVGVTAALMTSFYSWRLIFLTFFGKPRWAGSEHIQHAVHDNHGHDGHQAHDDHAHGHAHHDDGTAGYHPHESPLSMLIPLGVLTLGAVFAGWVFSHGFLESAEFWGGSLFYNEHLMHAMHEVPLWVKLSASIVMLIGLAGAWYSYIRNPEFPAKVVDQIDVLYRFVYNKWYFDELYNFLFVRPAFWLGDKFWKLGDIGFIDRFGPNGAAWTVQQGTRFAQKVQSGYLYSYALVMLLGLTAAITWIMVR
jgi:NADH-quinone oxidoreductase subunit L